jgi:putative addiction module component (TIGR02574 family)
MSGGACAHTGAASATISRAESSSKPIIERRDLPVERISTSFVDGFLLDGFITVNEELSTQEGAVGFQIKSIYQLLDRCRHSVNYSPMSLTSIQDEIVLLSSTERAMLIDILWESLDEDRVKEIEAKWAAESEERIDAVDRGELQTVDGPTALGDLRSSLRK